MAAVVVVQVAFNDVIHVIAMRRSLVSTVRSVPVHGIVSVAVMLRRTVTGIR